MNLREYQHEAKHLIRGKFSKSKRIVCALPTGSGKTVIGSSVIKSSLGKGKSVAIIVHRIEILKQFYKSLHAFNLKHINFIVSESTRRHLTNEGFYGTFHKRPQQLNLCMVETFHRRYNKRYADLPIDFYIMDEIHWGSYRKLCSSVNFAHILGFTATPKTTSNVDPLNTYFDDIVCPISVSGLIELGFLVRGRTFSIEYDFSGLQIRMGEFTENSMYKEFKKPTLFKGVVENYERYAKGKRAICYNVNVKHSQEICEEFNIKGIRAAHVDGKTDPRERSRIFADYEKNRTSVLCNVGVATTGYDNPPTECIIENRATTQLTLHHQMLGRGGRPFQPIFGEKKKEFIIIDMGRNYLRHGLYGEDVDWTDIFHNPNKAVQQKEVRKLKECKECGAIIKISLIRCPYCGTERTVKEIKKDFEDSMTTKEIRDYKFKNLPQHLRGRRFGEMNDAELREYGRLMGYKNSWFYVIRSKLKR